MEVIKDNSPDWYPRVLAHEKQTNHDYIRTCSEADLADLLCKLVLVSSPATVGCKGCVVKDDCGGRSSGFLKWLRQDRQKSEGYKGHLQGLETEEMMGIVTPEAEFVVAVLVILLGVVVLAVMGAAVVLIAHAHRMLAGKEEEYVL